MTGMATLYWNPPLSGLGPGTCQKTGRMCGDEGNVDCRFCGWLIAQSNETLTEEIRKLNIKLQR